MNWKLFSILLLVALASIFIVQNAEVVELRFLFWKVVMSRALMFVFILLTGIAVGWLLHSHLTRKQRHEEQNMPESYE